VQDESYNQALGRLRLLVTFFVVLSLLFFSRPRPGDLLLGAVLLVAGEATRSWAAGHLVKNRKLITSGPYRHCRNPLYLGRLLIFSGIAVCSRLPHAAHLIVWLLGLLVFFGYYLPRKERVEPERLRQLHGDAYDRYRDAVPSLWPRLRPWPEADRRRWALKQALANREQWLLVGLLLLMMGFLWRATTI
jgi:protein-S-isoprenylcysteine O-methyltransferase Ste14